MTTDDAALEAFTRRGSGAGPKATFSLVLMAVTVAVLAMEIDRVQAYSHAAFATGVGLTVVLALVVSKVVEALKGNPRQRLLAALVLPAGFGALIGIVVQAIILAEVGTSHVGAVKDLGGLVDTTQPGPWLASGILLGGNPALLVSVFLLAAGRALRRLSGHDAAERFGVFFIGVTGIFAGLGLLLVDDFALPPLFVVAMASSVTLLVVWLIDGARIRFLERVYDGTGEDFEIVAANRFSADPSLLPIVAEAGTDAILVRSASSASYASYASYRVSASVPIAFVGATKRAGMRPLFRRRTAAFAMLAATVALVAAGAIAAIGHS